jgi:peroxiredoxin
MKKLYALVAVLAFASIGLLIARSQAADSTSPAATIGKPAPMFTLQDQNGNTVSLKDDAGKIIVLEWTNPDCPYVQQHYKKKTMQTLAAEYKDKDVVWIAINSTDGITNAADKKWAAEQSIPYPILNDASGKVGKLYHATNTPDMYIIGKDGTLLYKGAIDNNPEEDQPHPVNYVHKALEEILAGKSVTTPETKPYGCGVKYAD